MKLDSAIMVLKEGLGGTYENITYQNQSYKKSGGL